MSTTLRCYWLGILNDSGSVYLVYYFPDAVASEGLFRFHSEVVRVNIDPERARTLFEDAVACLKGPLPKQHSACAFCGWRKNWGGKDSAQE